MLGRRWKQAALEWSAAGIKRCAKYVSDQKIHSSQDSDKENFQTNENLSCFAYFILFHDTCCACLLEVCIYFSCQSQKEVDSNGSFATWE